VKTDEIIKLIAAFGIGTIVSTIFSFIKSTKRNQLDYITKERSEWRKGIRKIIVKLLGSDLDKKKNAVNQLKTQLNPYGFRRNYKYGKDYYMADGHIWDELEDFDFSENRIQRIVQYLVLLLKFDWERSKDEVGIDQNNIIWNALRWILIVLNSVMLVWAGQVNNEKNTYFAFISLILLLLQKLTLKLLSGLNLDSRKSQFAFFIAFIFVFLLPYIYSIHLVVLLLNFYKIIKNYLSYKSYMKIIENGTITDVKEIKATGISAKLKKSGKKDMALIYSEEKAVSAAVFTKNLVLLQIKFY